MISGSDRETEKMQSTSPTQPGGSPKKTYSRHHHRATQTPTAIDSKSRRDIELLRRRNRYRLMKWCAIGFSLLAIVLTGIFFLMKQP